MATMDYSASSPFSYRENQYLEANFTGGAGGGGLQAASDRVRYVSNSGNDSNTGLGWSDAKATIQAALAELDFNFGGTVYVGGGAYEVTNTLVIKNKVNVIGSGRDATRIRAGAGFPIDTPLIRLGNPTETQFAFGCRIESMTLDCNNVAGSTGVWATNLQEMSGVSRCIVANFKKYGIDFGLGSDNWDIDNCEIYPSETGATAGIIATSNIGQNSVRRCTFGVNGPLEVGLHIKTSSVFAQSIHIETCVDGILWENSDGALIGASGPTASFNVTNLVRMTSSSAFVYVAAITKNGATNAVRDDFFNRTITNSFVQSMTMGDMHVAQLYHYGHVLGFYGMTPIERPVLTLPEASDPASTQALVNDLVGKLLELGLIGF